MKKVLFSIIFLIFVRLNSVFADLVTIDEPYHSQWGRAISLVVSSSTEQTTLTTSGLGLSESIFEIRNENGITSWAYQKRHSSFMEIRVTDANQLPVGSIVEKIHSKTGERYFAIYHPHKLKSIARIEIQQNEEKNAGHEVLVQDFYEVFSNKKLERKNKLGYIQMSFSKSGLNASLLLDEFSEVDVRLFLAFIAFKTKNKYRNENIAYATQLGYSAAKKVVFYGAMFLVLRTLYRKAYVRRAPMESTKGSNDRICVICQGTQGEFYNKIGSEEERESCASCTGGSAPCNVHDESISQIDEEGNPLDLVLPCSHRFHKECLQGWRESQDSKAEDAACPNCRAPIWNSWFFW